MRCSRFSKPTRILVELLAMLAMSLASLTAQSAGDCRLSYDANAEVTLTGTVSSVLPRPALGMIMGSHLVLTTVSGTVDTSLGRWGLLGKGALSVEVGQQIEVTGVIKTLRGKPVLLARTIKAGGQVHILRNEHGIPMSPQARERAGHDTAQIRESL